LPLPKHFIIRQYDSPLKNGVEWETKWMELAASELEATAHFWQAPVGWVVPKRYVLNPVEEAGSAPHFQVRASGGGLVPQGPGIWNLSLVWAVDDSSKLEIGAIYRRFCARLTDGLKELGIFSEPGLVNGSFCDGRFNLAVHGRKLVGTAQAWKRIQTRQIVLAHAVILVDVDTVGLARSANEFEAAIGSDVRYNANAITCVAQESCFGGDVEVQALSALAEQFSKQEEISYGLN